MTFLVHINKYSYAVDDGSVADVETRVLDAVRAGGAFTDIPCGGVRQMRVLITPASMVRIEPVPRPVLPLADEEFPDIAFTELDL